ncbi:hypothetical protein HAX54_006742 [Datura stramonium]|uniref:Uncharacterized protein n=1 Tax=Datura stramonium TaxID=4076 RepID=A0ABS8TAQ0_DATST|nr:hypothetical protein [Datura stramonium]
MFALSLGILMGRNQHVIEHGGNKVFSEPRCVQWHQGMSPVWQVRDKILSVARQLDEDLKMCGMKSAAEVGRLTRKEHDGKVGKLGVKIGRLAPKAVLACTRVWHMAQDMIEWAKCTCVMVPHVGRCWHTKIISMLPAFMGKEGLCILSVEGNIVRAESKKDLR